MIAVELVFVRVAGCIGLPVAVVNGILAVRVIGSDRRSAVGNVRVGAAGVLSGSAYRIGVVILAVRIFVNLSRVFAVFLDRLRIDLVERFLGGIVRIVERPVLLVRRLIGRIGRGMIVVLVVVLVSIRIFVLVFVRIGGCRSRIRRLVFVRIGRSRIGSGIGSRIGSRLRIGWRGCGISRRWICWGRIVLCRSQPRSLD